ncbi:hypothetical protein PVAG01_11063 [Phlyctema vagabunda]|uniref:DUF605-domain-containing protein n=1 Tax=Phlyctema vagabunda TaxID=108571 RepID=A0ABR4P408_9HELO
MTSVPAKLKTPDLAPFIVRATQLEKAKPAIAYWCEYWIVNQVIARGLHNSDAECLQYTVGLMDKLEATKSANASNDAIVDDIAGQAYVEGFATETFLRADRAVQADKVTRQTADTFQAAATFYELVNIWGAPDEEILAKIKYAKWNAIRILRALKEGKDPNESNPKPEPTPEEDLPVLDPNDPEVEALSQSQISHQASVEEVPDEQDTVEARLAKQSALDRSLHPSAQPSARGSPGTTPNKEFDPYPRDGFPYTATQKDEVSPLEPNSNERHGSVGGGYFPEVPPEVPTSDIQDATAPPDDTIDLGLPDTSTLSAPGTTPAPDFSAFLKPAADEPSIPPPQDYYKQAPPPAASHPYFPPPPTQPAYIPPTVPTSAPIATPKPTQRTLNTDDVAIAKAQKHARWAISALNFEDAETAVKELRAALETLGAQ